MGIILYLAYEGFGRMRKAALVSQSGFYMT